MSVSASFTATGAGGTTLLRAGERITYSVSGTFVGNWQIEQSDDGGATWTVRGADNDVGTGTVASDRAVNTLVRFYCTSYTSGTMVTALTDVADVIQSFEDGNSVAQLQIVDGGVVIPHQLKLTDDADATKTVVFDLSNSATGTDKTLKLPTSMPTSDAIVTENTAQTMTNKTLTAPTITNATLSLATRRKIQTIGAKVGTTAGWVVGAADDIGKMATLPASQTASTLVVPLMNLKTGDTITAFFLNGGITSAGGTVTVDLELRSLTATAGGSTDATVASMTQVSVTASTKMSSGTVVKSGLTQAVGNDTTFYLLITATTAGSTSIDLQDVGLIITEV